MTDVDPVSRAARALQKLDATQPERAKGTRARILLSLHARRQKRNRRWLTGLPLGILILGGSAWAQSGGHLTQLWENVEELATSLGVVASKAAEPDSSRARRAQAAANNAANPSSAALSASTALNDVDNEQLEPQRAATLVVNSSTPLPPPTEGVLPNAPPPEEPRVNAASPRQLRAALSARSTHATRELVTRSQEAAPSSAAASTSSAASPPPPPLPPAPDPEIALFRLAHDLHFKQQSAREASQAYTDYLARYPRGRFVPEARYNRALDRLRLGEKAAARRDLEAFARGDYGAYRKVEASALLKRVDSATPATTTRTP